MYEEREILTKYIFPRLRNKYAAQNLILKDVDLRWGIPEEDELGILNACIEELQRSQYVIVMLGDRYGTQVGSITNELIQKYPWLSGLENKSITELEITHTLECKNFSEQAISCYIKSTPSHDKLSVKVGSSELEVNQDHRQIELKDRVRSESFNLWEYSSSKEFGELVYLDVSGYIDQQFSDLIEIGQDSSIINFEDYIFFNETTAQKLSKLIGEKYPAILVYGLEGTGKTTFLRQWVDQTVLNHDELEVFSFFCSSSGITSVGALLSRMIREVNKKFNLEHKYSYKEHVLKELFPDWLITVGNSASARIVIVIDGIEFLDREGFFDTKWIPETIPNTFTFVLSTNDPSVKNNLEERFTIFEINGLLKAEQEKFIATYLATYGKRLSKQLMENVTQSTYAHLPAFLKSILVELRLHGSYETLIDIVNYYTQSISLVDFYKKFVRRIVEDYDLHNTHLGDTLKLIACS